MKRSTGVYNLAGNSTRRSQRRSASGLDRLKDDWKTHVVMVLLAVFIWWTLKQGVDDEETIDNRVRLEARLDPSDNALQARYALASQPTLSPSLRVTGPRKEISDLQEFLDRREKGAVFQFTVTQSDLESLTPDHEHRIALSLPTSRFEDTLGLRDLHEVSVEFAQPDIEVNVIFEEKLSIPAVFETDGIVNVPEAYRADVTVKTAIQAFGQWSRLKPYSAQARNGKKLRLVSTDIGPDIVAALKDKTPEEKRAYLNTPRSLKLGIQPVEGIEFQDDEGNVLTAVSVEVSLAERQGFVLEKRDIPIDILWPHWMLEKRVEINPIDRIRSLNVELLVDPAKRSAFTAENVRLILDLRSISPSIGQPREGAPNTQIAEVNVPLRLEVNRNKLPYRIPLAGDVTEERFYDYDLKLVWAE